MERSQPLHRLARRHRARADHGVTQAAARLGYSGPAGALNEHISDVFGSLVKQYTRGEDAGEAGWLIGDALFAPGVRGEAVRSMARPGEAYDDQRIGRAPQVAHMRDYDQTADDNGGVHTAATQRGWCARRGGRSALRCDPVRWWRASFRGGGRSSDRWPRWAARVRPEAAALAEGSWSGASAGRWRTPRLSLALSTLGVLRLALPLRVPPTQSDTA